ncbi:hypothetical protein [Amycolatopsis magusensis]|uniref:hypothetical protein n=1 Tax=Amycolatopsis magusensis TaxID=882444 RepID=UPI0024A9674B|nr:hypothetical protein [Amycolatopsis magusensis]MDI5974995.1 hypothetical protein [Amycolatopsis magusensis]
MAGAATLSGCGILQSRHEVGECVKTRPSLGGTEITSAECPAGSGFDTSSLGDPVYRISEVLEIDGHCQRGGSIGGIELKHEPDDAVYCLDPAGV